jgi:hypothetical protein
LTYADGWVLVVVEARVRSVEVMTMSGKLTLGGLEAISNNLESPPVHIPNGNGGAYKTELALFRSQERTEKIIWWHTDDPRQEPHNHPWRFESTILSGGYSENRWWFDENGALQQSSRTYRKGDVNTVEANVFHVVFDVEPKTVTHLICGNASENNIWGYLSLEDFTYFDAERNPDFVDLIRAINPHLRPTSKL